MIEFLTKNSIVIVTIIVYGIVFVIQKAQFKKQNEIMSKYEKVFAIFNIDEIEKYVELQKKSVNLSFGNREKELINLENNLSNKLTEIEETLNDSINLKDILTLKNSEIDSFTKKIETIEMKNELFMEKLEKKIDVYYKISELYKQEFKDIYEILKETIKNKNPQLFVEIDSKIIENINKYNEKRNEIMIE